MPGRFRPQNTTFRTVRPPVLISRPIIPWATAPLLWPTLFFAGGIAAAAALGYGCGHFWLGAAALGFVSGLSLHLRPRPSTFLLLLSLFATGAWYATERHPPNRDDHFGRTIGKDDLLLGTVDAVKGDSGRWTAELRVTTLLHDDTTLPASGRLIAYLRGNAPRYGDRLLLASRVEPLGRALNPEAFDYAAYLAGRGIYHRTFADSGQWQQVGRRSGFSLRALGEASRDAWFASLTPYLSGDDLAVAAALIMGRRDLLGSEVRSAYADTGAIHVLAVSGLHVGILALLVVQLLRLLFPPRPFFRYLGMGLTVVVVWYFALVTGLSASVQRAALMVTVVVVGKGLNRNNSLFNLLAIAALIMLVAEPKQLFQVGFQLSFAAVAGIGLFTRKLQSLLYLPRSLRWTWDAISVSVAAQLGTLPLSLYYFGQFPLYFLLSGTLVIGFAYLTLGLGLLHGVLATFGGTLLTGPLLAAVVALQNAFIFFCRQLPGARLEIASFGLPSAIGLYLLIGGLAYLAYRPSHRGRWWVMGWAGTLVLCWSVGPALYPEPARFVVYQVPRASLVDVFDGRAGLAIGDSPEEEALRYNVLPLRKRLGYTVDTPLPWRTDTSLRAAAVAYPLLRLLDRRVLVLDGRSDDLVITDWEGIDLVLVRNGFRPGKLAASIPEGVEVVVDGSSPPWIAKDWREVVPRAHLTAEDGAYMYYP
jgi:competence protein ComEC